MIQTTTIRPAKSSDLDGIVVLDAAWSASRKRSYWARLLSAWLDDATDRVALVAEDATGRLVGHLFGEIRAWEFGSEPCGWIFAVAVHPNCARRGIASDLCREAMRRFRDMGVSVVRTMVQRDAVPVLAFFRSMGFRAGRFMELERSVWEDGSTGDEE